MMNMNEVNRYGVFSPPGSIQLDNPEIRFIDSHYKELFRIPDGGAIKITGPDGQMKICKCKYIDETHFMANLSVYHICQFAEIMERCGSRYEPAGEEM